MVWKMLIWLWKPSWLYVSIWCLLLQPSYGFSWTRSEWIGVIEASAGTVVLRATISPASDICENCSGTGRLGDGVVSVECPVCDGTGKPQTPGSYSAARDCPTCSSAATIKSSPSPPGMDAPAVKQEAATGGGGTYKRGLFRRR